MGISLAGIGQKLGFHLSSLVIYQAGIGQKDEIVGKWSIHRKIICAPKNKFEDTVFDMGVHKKPRAWKSYGFATSTWYFNLDWIHYLYEDTMFHTRWSDYLEISTQKKNTPENEHSCTHPARIHGNYTKRHFLPFECVARRCNILRSRNVGRASWKLATGSTLTPCYNEMLFSFKCLHPPELRNEIDYLSWPFQAVYSFVAVLF